MEPERKRVKYAPLRRPRAPYAAVACDPCHGRKVRCSGERPCSRCIKQNIPCSYPTAATPQGELVSDDPTGDGTTDPVPGILRPPGQSSHRQATGLGIPDGLLTTIDTLQLQLNDFKAKLDSRAMPMNPSYTAITTTSRQLQPFQPVSGNPSNARDGYAGPTSFAWSMGTADSKLSTLAKSLGEPSASGPATPEQSPQQPSPLHGDHPGPQTTEMAIASEQLNKFSVDDVAACLDTFQKIFGVLHPLPHLDQIRHHSSSLLRIVKRSLTSQQTSAGQCGLLEIFKIVLAIAIGAAAGSPTGLSGALYRSVEPVLSAASVVRTISHDFRSLFLLAAIYHFGNDDLIMGARMIMLAGRTAVEEGLYRKEALVAKVPNSEERQVIIRQLWSIFVLDRQLNFSAGLACILNPDDIDLPSPENSPYLAAMVDYVQFGTHAWNSVVDRNALASGQGPTKDLLKFFHYQLHRWHQDIDPAIRFDAATIESDSSTFFLAGNKDGGELETYLKTLLYLRSNQIQILVLRPMLSYSRAARSHPSLIADAIAIASRSIQTLAAMSMKTTLYVGRYAIFNHFLSSAMTVLLLAITHEVEKQASGTTDTAKSNTSLGEIVKSVHEGFAILNRHRSVSQSSARLWALFERPRRQLVRLGLLNSRSASQPESPGRRDRDNNSACSAGRHNLDSVPHAATGGLVIPSETGGGGVVDSGAHVEQEFTFNENDLINFDPLNYDSLDLDWPEASFTDPLGSFGLSYWL